MSDAIEMKVNENGFEPSELHVRAGREVRLHVKRTFARTCATSIEAPDVIAKTRLPLGETIEIRFTPTRVGTYRFGCAMGQHVGGSLVVKD